MKKHYSLRLIFIVLLGFCYSNLYAQDKKDRFPLSDAIYFSSQSSNTEKARVLMAYFKDAAALSNNKFIDTSALNFTQILGFDPLEVQASQSGETGNSLGETLLNSLGTVIAKRFKEELTLAFLENFRDKLKDQPYLGELFPNAKLILLYGDPFNHKNWLSSFRGALDEDLRALPDNIPGLLEEIKSKVGLDEKQNRIIELLVTSYSPIKQVFKNPEQSFLSASSLLDSLSKFNFKNENMSSGLTLMHILIKEMGNAKYDDWADERALNRLSNPAVAAVFIGLTIEKYKDVLEGENVSVNGQVFDLYTFLNSSYAKMIVPIRNYISSIIQNVNSISEIVNNLRLLKETRISSGEKLVYSDFQPLIDQSIESLKQFLDESMLQKIGLNSSNLSEIINKIETSSKFVNNVYQTIDSKEYSKIIVAALTFITENIPENKLISSAALREFSKYTSFAVNIVGAETSEEMTSAIESGILPVQSYRLKRNNALSISINSFAGVFAANEFLLNNDAKNKSSGVVGFTAPIGIAFNFGLNIPTIENGLLIEESNKKLLGSISIYATIIDIGAITTYRLTNDEDPIEGVEWQNVFAPGLYLVFGIQNTPLALSIGGQYGPELRSVKAVDGVATSIIDSRAFRLGVSLTVDIPLLHLYSKTEKVTSTE